MERVIVTGKNIQEALSKGIEQLNVEKEQIEYKILQEAKSGFLGLIGNKVAKVEVIRKFNKKEKVIKFLEEIINEMGLNVQVVLLKEDTTEIIINLTGEDLGIIIGHRGKTLDALQYLSNLVINKRKNDYIRVILEAEGYRERRRKTLESLTIKMANKAKKTGRKVILDPMPAHERKIIHEQLHGRDDINTYSVGKDSYRKVIIEAK